MTSVMVTHLLITHVLYFFRHINLYGQTGVERKSINELVEIDSTIHGPLDIWDEDGAKKKSGSLQKTSPSL